MVDSHYFAAAAAATAAATNTAKHTQGGMDEKTLGGGTAHSKNHERCHAQAYLCLNNGCLSEHSSKEEVQTKRLAFHCAAQTEERYHRERDRRTETDTERQTIHVEREETD